MPPFSRLVALIVSGADEAAVVQTANALGRAAPRGAEIDVLGPAPAPRYLHAMGYDAVNQGTLIHGGMDAAYQSRGETWFVGAVCLP